MEAIESLTRSIQGNFNRRKEWDAVLACAVKLAKDRLDEVNRLRESNLISDEKWESAGQEQTQLIKTIQVFEDLRDLEGHR